MELKTGVVEFVPIEEYKLVYGTQVVQQTAIFVDNYYLGNMAAGVVDSVELVESVESSRGF